MYIICFLIISIKVRKLAWLIGALISTRKSSVTLSSFLVILRGGGHFQGINLPPLGHDGAF